MDVGKKLAVKIISEGVLSTCFKEDNPMMQYFACECYWARGVYRRGVGHFRRQGIADFTGVEGLSWLGLPSW